MTTDPEIKIDVKQLAHLKTSLLQTMAEQADLERQAKYELRTLAVEARAAGATWQQIGNAVGTSKQAAAIRYSRYTEPRNDEQGE